MPPEPTPVVEDANATRAELQQRAADDYEAQTANAADHDRRDDAHL
ncbi:hypothetical protein GCM10011583_11750 [Streptomyces camponoticapitis]|uniref:Uncharacterized protein n=1 Tax=Streptomyces camponoticapitis TaxID=1616125 RepID=A0ABQ2E168_9ACTN|nr:hypothetical protein [Streptomyces camponoticapitis]GGJ81927.1 hypothetical protein GCM10011583_11750 [Streptomyces camponoticapitis]